MPGLQLTLTTARSSYCATRTQSGNVGYFSTVFLPSRTAEGKTLTEQFWYQNQTEIKGYYQLSDNYYITQTLMRVFLMSSV